MKTRSLLLFLFLTSLIYSQEYGYPVTDIPETLLKNANLVIRFEKQSVDISDRQTMKTSLKRVTTVLNVQGFENLGIGAHYDPVSKIKLISATILDAAGIKQKTYEKKDFIDRSAVDGVSIFTDSRLLLLNYTPTSFPYTIIYNLETVTENTAFIGGWYLNGNHHISTQESIYEIKAVPELGLRNKVQDTENYFTKEEAPGYVKLVASSIPATAPEEFAPSYDQVSSNAKFALDKFHLEGVNGEASDWSSFGAWMNKNLIKETQDLDAQTKFEVLKLTEGLDPLEKARVIYEFMQRKTRYISVQIGIGGWKPMLASEVHNLSYGDCKALTNYTQSLLTVVGVPSYYTIVHAGRNKRDVTKDFTAMQGNHAILSIPTEDDLIWLECTSQQIPFGFSGDFTDDRDVLVVTPQGGKIVHTKKYDYSSNVLENKADFTLLQDGTISGNVIISSSGLIYDERYFMDQLSSDNQISAYKRQWSHLPNLQIESHTLINDKRSITLQEEVALVADNYTSSTGNDLLLKVNVLNRWEDIPQREKNRKYEVLIPRGKTEITTITIHLPEKFEVASLPDAIAFTNMFGSYTAAIEMVDAQTLTYTRQFKFKEGNYPKEEYKNLRNFLKKVARNDNRKIALTKKL